VCTPITILKSSTAIACSGIIGSSRPVNSDNERRTLHDMPTGGRPHGGVLGEVSTCWSAKLSARGDRPLPTSSSVLRDFVDRDGEAPDAAVNHDRVNHTSKALSQSSALKAPCHPDLQR
jgi:hypothetical protein